jgi:methyl-accepting chemotaxis protein
MRRHFSFAQLPISQRLGIGFALAGFLAVIIALTVGIGNTASLQQVTGSFNQALGTSVSLGQIRSDLEQMQTFVSNRLAFGETVNSTPLVDQVTSLASDLDRQIKIYLATIGHRIPQLVKFEQDWELFREVVKNGARLLDSNLPSAEELARRYLTSTDPDLYGLQLGDLDALVHVNQQQVNSAHITAGQSNFATFWSALAWALIGFFVLITLARYIVFSIVRQLEGLLALTHLVNQGDLSQRATIGGQHEVAVVAASMNDMLDTIGDLLVKEESLRTGLEDQIEHLIAEVTPIGQGDLRIQAQVTHTQLGILADVFNLIAEQLTSLVARVQQNAALTYAAAGSIVHQATTLAKAASQQAEHLGQANEGMSKLASAAAAVARLARASEATATEIVNGAQRGGQAALQVLERVKQGTEQVRTIKDQMQVLNNHSMEISGIVHLIEEIARQTQLLSINAEVQAEQAGIEFSRGFSVVAEEIRRLARRAEEAVQQVTMLVRMVQGDVYSVTITTDQTAGDFAELAHLTDEASRVLQGIWTRIARQTTDIQEIRRVAVWQESVAREEASLIEKLAAMAKQIGETALHQQTAARNLSEVSQVLQASISAFRLPGPALPDVVPGQ